MSQAEKILKLAMQDPIAASELISNLADPVVGLAKEMLNKYGSEIGDQIKAADSFTTELDIQRMKQYTENGFSRDEALNLIIVRKQAAANAMKAMQK